MKCKACDGQKTIKKDDKDVVCEECSGTGIEIVSILNSSNKLLSDMITKQNEVMNNLRLESLKAFSDLKKHT